jgi:hypothetical protein
MSSFTKHGHAGTLKRRIAIVGAVLILAAQFVGVIHWHRAAPSDQITAHSELALDNGLCALCLLAFHSNFSPSTGPVVYHGAVATRQTVCLLRDVVLSSRSASTPSRAPPFTA